MNHEWLDRLERKYRRYSISNLMSFIVMGMGLIYITDLVLHPLLGFSISSLLAFDRAAILHGQIWRLVTFIFIPPNSSILFIILSLYFYWVIGTGLVSQWGSFRFNVFYLFGIIGTIIAGMITGYTTNTYLNLSLFLAFAMVYPDFQVNLFYILPIKVKYLALIDALSIVGMFITATLSGKLAVLMSIINVIIFFWSDMVQNIRNAKRRYEWRKKFKN